MNVENAATEALRERALTAPASSFGAPADAPAWLALMEFRHGDASVTLMCAWDGTCSLLFSTGGGVIGAGEHEEVARASVGFVEEAGAWAADFAVASEVPHPAEGVVRFWVRRGDELLWADAPEGELVDASHELAGLHTLGQAAITHVRRVSGG